jgi:hypothetical protein
MKLIFAYSFWLGDDWEMLKKSVENHAPYVDKIIICYQTKSNKGEDSGNELDFQMLFPDCVLIKYTPDLRINTKANELRKHNEMLEVIKSLGATHFVIGAADHFYNGEDFRKAVSDLESCDKDVSITAMFTYYKNVNWRVDPIEDYYMPFVHRCSINLKFERSAKYPVIVDPSVKVNFSKGCIVYGSGNIMLHHYSMIRKDVEKKFRNAAASIRWTPEQIERFVNEYKNAKPGDSIEYFKGRKLIEVPISFLEQF